jgi:hypothetical protein
MYLIQIPAVELTMRTNAMSMVGISIAIRRELENEEIFLSGKLVYSEQQTLLQEISVQWVRSLAISINRLA